MKLDEIEEYLASVELPTEQVIINKCEVIIDAKRFVEYHIEILKRNSGKRVFVPYYDRLLFFVNYLKSKQACK